MEVSMDGATILSGASLAWNAVMALATGGVAGGVVYAGITWKQKNAIAAIHRTERFVGWVVEIAMEIARVHNELHPDNPIDVSGLAKLLFDNGGRKSHDSSAFGG
jgi:uncharacterized membrane protein YfbV (UPF0208 family)